MLAVVVAKPPAWPVIAILVRSCLQQTTLLFEKQEHRQELTRKKRMKAKACLYDPSDPSQRSMPGLDEKNTIIKGKCVKISARLRMNHLIAENRDLESECCKITK